MVGGGWYTDTPVTCKLFRPCQYYAQCPSVLGQLLETIQGRTRQNHLLCVLGSVWSQGGTPPPLSLQPRNHSLTVQWQLPCTHIISDLTSLGGANYIDKLGEHKAGTAQLHLFSLHPPRPCHSRKANWAFLPSFCQPDQTRLLWRVIFIIQYEYWIMRTMTYLSSDLFPISK